MLSMGLQQSLDRGEELPVLHRLHEHGGAGLLIDHPAGPRRLDELLPDAFGAEVPRERS